jgi:hypothetical protein
VTAYFQPVWLLQRRYVPGVAWYEGSGTSDRRWCASDQLGSVIALTDVSGARIGAADTYNAYGQRGASNAGRFHCSSRRVG